MRLVFHVGRYFVMLGRVFKRPQNGRMFRIETVREMWSMGVNSVGIVLFISFFVGAVVALQMAYNVQDSALMPDWYIGYATRESIILEFSPTLLSLILIGKVGSSISSNIGTMRITEQIDALEVMGVNSANFLILPKITAALVFFPLLIGLSMVSGIVGGMLSGTMTGMWSATDYIHGITDEFIPYNVVYAFIKTVIFAFLISSITSYHGYYAHGGALDVGRSSTQGVVYASIAVIILNYVLTQILL